MIPFKKWAPVHGVRFGLLKVLLTKPYPMSWFFFGTITITSAFSISILAEDEGEQEKMKVR